MSVRAAPLWPSRVEGRGAKPSKPTPRRVRSYCAVRRRGVGGGVL